jgi:subtilisin family serine protease
VYFIRDDVKRAKNYYQAISYSISEWMVDIISMSFGLAEDRGKVREAIQRASMHGILVFAAASNRVPARLPGVICIHSADGHGNAAAFNPSPLQHDINFSTLGEAIPVSVPQQGKQTQLVSGSSFATPIAVGIAATLLQFARQKQTDGLLSSAEVEHLHRPEGMASVLKAMGQSRDGMSFIQPWKLWDDDELPDRSIKRIQSALAESLGPQQAVEDDVYETASITGFSVAGQSDLSGSTAVGDGPTSMDEAIAFLLLEDPVMKPLFNPGVARTGLASFHSHFTRLLHLHASRLRREAETKLENEFANLVSAGKPESY